MKRQVAAVWTWVMCLAAAFLYASVVGAHPHGPDSTVYLTGTLTKVDLELGAIEVDTIDKRTLTKANVLLFVEKKARLRHGKRRLTLADLSPGQQVSCVAEREEDNYGRLVAFDIRVLDKS
jgi:hypothetical protein